jgi:hypothetical protein
LNLPALPTPWAWNRACVRLRSKYDTSNSIPNGHHQ